MVDGHAAGHDKVNWPHLAESHRGRDTCGGLLGRSLPRRDEEDLGVEQVEGLLGGEHRDGHVNRLAVGQCGARTANWALSGLTLMTRAAFQAGKAASRPGA
jgi:hypothetical protein